MFCSFRVSAKNDCGYFPSKLAVAGGHQEVACHGRCHFQGHGEHGQLLGISFDVQKILGKSHN